MMSQKTKYLIQHAFQNQINVTGSSEEYNHMYSEIEDITFSEGSIEQAREF